MAGTEKNYKEHSGVSRGAALKRAHGSNDIAVFVASRRVEDNRRASFFFTGFISDASNVEQRADRAGISLRGTETSSGSLSPLPLSSAGQLFHGAGPPCARFSSSGRVYRETINKIYTDARIYPVARSGQSGRGVKVVLPNGARYSRWYVGSKRNNIANSIRPHRTPSGL